MREDKFKRLIKEAFTEFLTSKEGEALVGTIMVKAVDQALHVEIDAIKGKEAAKNGEETVQKTEKMPILHLMAYYLPQIEGALRGMQEDMNKTKYSVDEQSKVNLLMMDLVQKSFKMGLLQPLIDARGKEKIELPEVVEGISYIRKDSSTVDNGG